MKLWPTVLSEICILQTVPSLFKDVLIYLIFILKYAINIVWFSYMYSMNPNKKNIIPLKSQKESQISQL